MAERETEITIVKLWFIRTIYDGAAVSLLVVILANLRVNSMVTSSVHCLHHANLSVLYDLSSLVCPLVESSKVRSA